MTRCGGQPRTSPGRRYLSRSRWGSGVYSQFLSDNGDNGRAERSDGLQPPHLSSSTLPLPLMLACFPFIRFGRPFWEGSTASAAAEPPGLLEALAEDFWGAPCRCLSLPLLGDSWLGRAISRHICRSVRGGAPGHGAAGRKGTKQEDVKLWARSSERRRHKHVKHQCNIIIEQNVSVHQRRCQGGDPGAARESLASEAWGLPLERARDWVVVLLVLIRVEVRLADLCLVSVIVLAEAEALPIDAIVESVVERVVRHVD